MASDFSSDSRETFARRLRELRVIRGFKTARSLAHALAIDENRYTRYERAEVEPSLDLIHRICRVLDIRPNDLLSAVAPSTAAYAGPGLAEEPRDWTASAAASRTVSAPLSRAQQVDALRWLIARELADLGPAVAPEHGLQRAFQIWVRLERPFPGIAEILAELGGDTTDHEARHRLSTLIDQLAHLLSEQRNPAETVSRQNG